MVVVHLAVVERAQEAGVDDCLGREELRRIAALEADARPNAVAFDRPLHLERLAPFDGERLLYDDVLAVAGRQAEL